jgi:diacylglycerol kinase family enzyme
MPAHSIQVTDDTLTWIDADHVRRQAAADEILFTIDVSLDEQKRYLICSLQEDADSPSRPFQATILSTAQIPKQLRSEHLIAGTPPHLQPTADSRVDVVVSTKSGIGRAQLFWQDVLRPLLQAVSSPSTTEQYNLIVTQDAQSVRSYARTLRDSSTPRTIVLISGDGGVVDLLNGHEPAPDAPLPLVALLPLGTGNALFHSLHKPFASTPGPTPLVLALRTLFLGVPAALPMFQATFTPGSRIVKYADPADENNQVSQVPHTEEVSSLYGAIVASHGFHASIVYESDTPTYRVHGSKRFAMVAQELLKLSHPYEATLDARSPSSDQFERDAHETHGYVLVSMVSNLESNFTISPASKPLDGKLHLVHFGPISGERAMEAMMKAYDGGKHVTVEWDDGEKVRYEEVGEVRIVSTDEGRWRVFCVDGTIVQVEKGGGMSVKRAERDLFRVLVDGRLARRTMTV